MLFFFCLFGCLVLLPVSVWARPDPQNVVGRPAAWPHPACLLESVAGSINMVLPLILQRFVNNNNIIIILYFQHQQFVCCFKLFGYPGDEPALQTVRLQTDDSVRPTTSSNQPELFRSLTWAVYKMMEFTLNTVLWPAIFKKNMLLSFLAGWPYKILLSSLF